MTRFVSMRLAAGAAAMLVGGGLAGPASAGQAELNAFLEICADPGRDAYEHLRACRGAIDQGLMEPADEARVWVNYGVAAVTLNDTNDALMAYTRAIVADPTLLQAYLNRAAVNMRRGAAEQALGDYLAVLDRDPTNMDALIGRGVILLRRGEAELAFLDFDMAALLHQSETAPFFTRGMANLNLGRPLEAERDFSRVLQLGPGDAEAHVRRGEARAAGEMPGAEEDFDRAVDLAPEWSGAWMARGRYLDATGDREAANRDFTRAYQLGHQDPWLVERMREISG